MSLLLFDIDGTITDTKFIDDQCFLLAFEKEFGVAAKFTGWASYKHVTDSAIFKELYRVNLGEIPREEHKQRFIQRFNGMMDEARKNNPAHFNEIPGAAAFVKHISSNKNFSSAFATGANKVSAKMKLNEIGIAMDEFPHASSNDSDSREEIMQIAIERALAHYEKEKFENIIYFGDGEWDFHATQNLNMPFIGVDVRQNGRLAKLGVKNLVRDFSDNAKIFEIIESLIG